MERDTASMPDLSRLSEAELHREMNRAKAWRAGFLLLILVGVTIKVAFHIWVLIHA